MFKIEMMSMMLDGDDDEVTHSDDVDHRENTTYIEWIVINTQTQLSCLYHILRYQIFKGAKRRLSTSNNLHTRLNNINFSHLCCSTCYANI